MKACLTGTRWQGTRRPFLGYRAPGDTAQLSLQALDLGLGGGRRCGLVVLLDPVVQAVLRDAETSCNLVDGMVTVNDLPDSFLLEFLGETNLCHDDLHCLGILRQQGV